MGCELLDGKLAVVVEDQDDVVVEVRKTFLDFRSSQDFKQQIQRSFSWPLLRADPVPLDDDLKTEARLCEMRIFMWNRIDAIDAAQSSVQALRNDVERSISDVTDPKAVQIIMQSDASTRPMANPKRMPTPPMTSMDDVTFRLVLAVRIQNSEIASLPYLHQLWVRIMRSVLGWGPSTRRGGMSWVSLRQRRPLASPWRAWLRLIRLMLLMQCGMQADYSLKIDALSSPVYTKHGVMPNYERPL